MRGVDSAGEKLLCSVSGTPTNRPSRPGSSGGSSSKRNRVEWDGFDRDRDRIECGPELVGQVVDGLDDVLLELCVGHACRWHERVRVECDRAVEGAVCVDELAASLERKAENMVRKRHLGVNGHRTLCFGLGRLELAAPEQRVGQVCAGIRRVRVEEGGSAHVVCRHHRAAQIEQSEAGQ